jgi:hypothetical protein
MRLIRSQWRSPICLEFKNLRVHYCQALVSAIAAQSPEL